MEFEEKIVKTKGKPDYGAVAMDLLEAMFATLGGFVAAGVVGRQLENVFAGTLTKDSELTKKFIGTTANDLPKAIGFWASRQTNNKLIRLAGQGVATSLGFDLLVRAFNDGTNPAQLKIGDWNILGSGSGNESTGGSEEIGNLRQQNEILTEELNRALQELADQPSIQSGQEGEEGYEGEGEGYEGEGGYEEAGRALETPMESRERKYGFVSNPEPTALETDLKKDYGFMQYESTPPAIQERERKYGFSGGKPTVAAMFGML